MQNDIEMALLNINNIEPNNPTQNNLDITNLNITKQPSIKQQAILFGGCRVVADVITNITQRSYPDIDIIAFKSLFSILMSYSGQKMLFNKKFSQEKSVIIHSIATEFIANIVSGVVMGRVVATTNAIDNEIGLNSNYHQYSQDFIAIATWVATEIAMSNKIQEPIKNTFDCNLSKTNFISKEAIAFAINVLSVATASYIAINTMKDIETNDYLEKIVADGTLGAIFSIVKSTMKYGLNYLSKKAFNESEQLNI